MFLKNLSLFTSFTIRELMPIEDKSKLDDTSPFSTFSKRKVFSPPITKVPDSSRTT